MLQPIHLHHIQSHPSPSLHSESLTHHASSRDFPHAQHPAPFLRLLLSNQSNNTDAPQYSILKTHHHGSAPSEILAPPPHFLDPSLFGLPSTKSSSSISIIFSIVNTMCGSTVLACPWGFHESGLVLACICLVVVAFCSYYTCTLVIRHTTMKNRDDFGEVCVEVLGKWSRILALLVSCMILVGAAIAYHIFMKDCLMSIVDGIFGVSTASGKWYWNDYWAAGAVALVLFPMVNFKTMTLLVKFNSFGIFFMSFLILYIVYACIIEIVQTARVHPVLPQPHNPLTPGGIVLFGRNCAHLLGILSLSFFIHNVISSILKNQKPGKSFFQTNRDVFSAFVMAAFTYGIPGVLGMIAFRYEPSIEQNFLNQFSNSDIAATVARFAVMLQLSSIFPLLVYIIRLQVFGYFMNTSYPGFFLVLIQSLVCLGISSAFAAFFPHVGVVLQWSGSIGGFLYLYLLPISLHVKVLHQAGKLRWYSVIGHSMLMMFGLGIIVTQFIPFEKFMH